MLRPATPLTVLLVAAFGLLLLSSLSTPVIKAVPIATFQGVQFGVLGYCKSASDCKGPMVGYSTDGLFSTASDSDFDLPSSARHSLSSILIIHPVAALLTLALAGLAGAAHVHAPAHSPRYQLMLLILLFPTLLISLMAFLIDLLLFVPHLAWGGWLSLAATVIIGISSIVACAMRHTLVSRKARKRRVDENDGMNGQNYNDSRKPKVESSVFPRAESPPPLSAQSLSPDMKAPHLAAFDIKSTSDDTMPLYPRDPPVQTAGSVYSGQPAPPGRRPPRDQYGNPMPNDGYNGFAMQNEPMRTIPPMRGGPQGFARGRGYPPRGGYGPPRGGYRPPGGPPGMMVRGPPPPGWNGGRGGMAPPAMGPPMGRGQRGPPAGYDNCMYGQGQPPGPAPGPYGPPGPADPARGSPGAQNAYGQRGVSPPRADALQPPGPIGQAVEMDARAGIPPSNYGLRESDGDGQGMLALQQAGFQGGGGGTPPRHISAGVASPTRTYSQPDNGSDPTLPSNGSKSRGLSPIEDASPVEMPAQLATMDSKCKSQDYYEDVDPQFAEPLLQHDGRNNVPNALQPGAMSSNPRVAPVNVSDANLMHSPSYEDMHEGARSPAASEASHFTSVSQRPVNPDWQPPPPGMGPPQPGQFAPYGAPRAMRQGDAILEANAANPDFAIPGVGMSRGGRGGRGGRGAARAPPPPFLPGIGPASAGGRYPGANAI